MLDGRKLKYMRQLKGWSRKQIAEVIGISHEWVKKVENNNERPSEEVYRKWLNALYSDIKLEPRKNGRPKVKKDK